MVDTNYVYVYLRDDLPPGVNELVSPGIDGYTVLISSRLDHEHQLRAYQHALKHIERGDFDIDQTAGVQEIEALAHDLKPSEAKPGDDYKKEIIEKLRKQRRSIRRKLCANDRKVKFLEQIGYDFFAAAEARWLDPECEDWPL